MAMEWIAARVTTTFLTVSDEEARDARRLWINRDAVSVRNGRDPAVFHPDPVARSRLRARHGGAGRPCRDRRGVPAGSAQGIPGAGRGDARRARCGASGWWASGWNPTAATTC